MSQNWEPPPLLELESVSVPEEHEIIFRSTRLFLTSVEVWNTMIVVHIVEAVAETARGRNAESILMLSAKDQNGVVYGARGSGTTSNGAGSPGVCNFFLDRPVGSEPAGGRLTLVAEGFNNRPDEELVTVSLAPRRHRP